MIRPGSIDSWVRRGIAVAAFVVPAAWVVPAGILQKLGLHTYWLTTLIIPCWIFQALIAAYYWCVWLPSSPRSRGTRAAALVLVAATGAAAAGAVAGVQPAVTVGLAILACPPFASGWSQAVVKILGLESTFPRFALTFYFALVPILIVLLASSAVYLCVALQPGMEGELRGAAALLASLAALLPAAVWNRKATRRARAIVSG